MQPITRGNTIPAITNEKVLLTNSSLWAAYDGLTSAYLVAFALALGATNLQVGILGALPWIANIITQIPGAELAQHLSRKKVYITFALIGRLIWIPLILTPYIFQHPIPFIILFYLLVKLGEMITEPSYVSLIADVIPTKTLGDFTSKKLRLIGISGVITLVLGGLWLKQYPKESPHGFVIMFAIGIILAITATLMMTRLKEPKYKDQNHHTIKEFFTLDGPMKQFVKFGVLFNFAFMLASPFFAVYMLKNLNLNYAYYGIVAGIATLAQITSSHYIGKLTDKYGDKPIAIIGHIGTAIVPLIFLTITPETIWLIIPAQIFSGLTWAAADISRVNLLLSLASPDKRAMQIAEYNLYTSITLVIAPILGGWITEHITIILTGIPLIFVISAILRLIASLQLFTIKEQRITKEYPVIQVLRHAISIHPGKGIEHGIHVIKRIGTGLIR